MKKVISALLLLCLALCLATPALAASPLVVDQADLLTATQEQSLTASLEQVSAELEMDVVVVTASTLDGKSPMAYADDYYDYHGYSPNGVLLLVSMEDRDWYITTTGEAIRRVEDVEVELIGEEIVPYLSSGGYYEAFTVYAEEVSLYANISGDWLVWLVLIGVGILAGLITVLIMKGQLKSVRSQSAASGYVVNGSFRLTGSNDLYLYRNVTRVVKSESSGGGSHSGSSGRSHGGGGGKF